MSIKHLKDLLAAAPSTANWWRTNQKPIKKVLRSKEMASFAAGCAMLTCIGVGFCLTVYFTAMITPIESFGGLLGVLLGSACMSVVLTAIQVWRGKMWQKWPTHFKPPCEITPNMFRSEHTIDLHQRKDILQRMINHPNADVQQCMDFLPQLQDLQLPDAWWWAVKNTLDTIPTQTHCHAKSPQKLLDEVYVEIEYKTEQNRSPKTLKV